MIRYTHCCSRIEIYFNPRRTFDTGNLSLLQVSRSPISTDFHLLEGADPFIDNYRSYPGAAVRVWDSMSRSQLQSNGRFLAEAGEMPLRTRASRVEALTNHSNWGNWGYPTPVVSATSSFDDAAIRARRQSSKNRGRVYLTVINPRARLRAGLPLLNAIDEMTTYGVPDPYMGGYGYYEHELLCPWIITEAEIVGTRPWDEISDHYSNGCSAWRESLASMKQ